LAALVAVSSSSGSLLTLLRFGDRSNPGGVEGTVARSEAVRWLMPLPADSIGEFGRKIWGFSTVFGEKPKCLPMEEEGDCAVRLSSKETGRQNGRCPRSTP
jgi:hypothetical protein